MTVSCYVKRWMLLSLLLVFTSCSGTGMDSGGSGGTGSPVVSSGAVTGFGSVIVNGTEFNILEETRITFNGQPGSEDGLRLGQVVTVRGTLEFGDAVGSAETIAVASNVAGPIDSIDLDKERLIVLGQLVLIDAATQFGDTSFDELMIGNIVVVGGFVDAESALHATRVEKTQDAFTSDIEIEATGSISNLDPDHQTFNLNELIVDYSGAQLVNVPDRLDNGQLVQVISSQNVMNGVLFADSVEGQTLGLPGNPGDLAELQGIITRVIPPTTFEVNGQRVQFTSDTVFEKGSADDIAVNVPVEIEGVFNNDGSIQAEGVEFSAGEEIRGVITAVTSQTAFAVNDQVVQITPDTTIRAQAVDDFQVGRHVEVSGFFNMDNVLVATEIQFFVAGTITTAVTPDNMFAVDGQPVRLTRDTAFDGGTTDNIVVNVPVDVEGFYDADDVFIAAEVDFSP